MPNKSPYCTQDFIDRAVHIWGDLYDYSSVIYDKSKKPVTIICKIHGTFEIKAGEHIRWLRPKGCIHCKAEEQEQRAQSKEAERAQRAKTPKNPPREKPKRIGKGSQGELMVKEALEVLGLHYEREISFPGCRDKNPLFFDFYLPDHRCLIEYQGEQHYKPIKYFGGEENFKKKQRRDAIKKKWAEDNGYLLLCIPHTVKRLDLIVQGLIERLEL